MRAEHVDTASSPFRQRGGVERGSVEQPQRHDETEVRSRIRPALGLERRRALRGLEGQPDFVRWNVPQDLEQDSWR